MAQPPEVAQDRPISDITVPLEGRPRPTAQPGVAQGEGLATAQPTDKPLAAGAYPRDPEIEEMGALIPKGIDTTSPGGAFQQHTIMPSEAGDQPLGIVRSEDREGTPTITLTKPAERRPPARKALAAPQISARRSTREPKLETLGDYIRERARNAERRLALAERKGDVQAQTAQAGLGATRRSQALAEAQARPGIEAARTDLTGKQRIDDIQQQFTQAETPEERELLGAQLKVLQGGTMSQKDRSEFAIKLADAYSQADFATRGTAEEHARTIAPELADIIYGKAKAPKSRAQEALERAKQ